MSGLLGNVQSLIHLPEHIVMMIGSQNMTICNTRSGHMLTVSFEGSILKYQESWPKSASLPAPDSTPGHAPQAGSHPSTAQSPSPESPSQHSPKSHDASH